MTSKSPDGSKFANLLITGAAGVLGKVLRSYASNFAARVRITDMAPLDDLEPHEEAITGDLAEREFVASLTKDVDAVVHLAAVTSEQSFDDIVRSNIVATQNIFSEAQKAGVRRVVWGSSNHAIGFYSTRDTIGVDAAPRPDSLYGVSKASGEALAQFYWEKFGLESVSIRIGSCVERPMNTRMLATWLSYPDFLRLIEAALLAPKVGHSVIYGVSANDARFWDNSGAEHIMFQPVDNAERFRAQIECEHADGDDNSPLLRYHGGDFVVTGR
ncbi:MAG: NAD-dependent epimerase/dehydratase family protein [Boseongicola sp.]